MARELEVEGLDEAFRQLNKLPKELIGKRGGPVKTALMAAANEIAKPTKQNLKNHPADISHMAKDVKRSREKNPRSYNEIIKVGIKAQKKLPMWWWYEFGTEDRIQKSTGRRTGRITANPFFRPAWEENKHKIPDTFIAKLKKKSEALLRKLGRNV